MDFETAFAHLLGYIFPYTTVDVDELIIYVVFGGSGDDELFVDLVYGRVRGGIVGDLGF